jgi:hypothetical protein
MKDPATCRLILFGSYVLSTMPSKGHVIKAKGKRSSRVVDEEFVEVQNRRGNVTLVSRPVTSKTKLSQSSSTPSQPTTPSLKRSRPRSRTPDNLYNQCEDDNDQPRPKRRGKVRFHLDLPSSFLTYA